MTELYQADSNPDLPSNALDAYLGTAEGMEALVDGVRKDGDTITVGGAEWFKYNGATVSYLYANGDHWIGIGASSANLKVCSRDGAMWYLYRQEGILYNYYRFLKVRWEGYTQYNNTNNTCKLVFEFFIFDTGDMFLNVIQTPTISNYIGVSSLTCNGITTALDIPAGSAPMITFIHQDIEGRAWEIQYKKISIKAPYDIRYLFSDADKKNYTITDGVLREISASSLDAQAFLDYGIDAMQTAPDWSLLAGKRNPKIHYWQDSQLELPHLRANVRAYPPPQEISAVADMSSETITGIQLITAEYAGQVGIKSSVDGVTYTDEVEISQFLNTDVAELWESVQGTKTLYLIFVLRRDARLSAFQITYTN